MRSAIRDGLRTNQLDAKCARRAVVQVARRMRGELGNAFDAHRVGTRDGRIEITLDMRGGGSGTLFVANSGRPFAEGDVKDLCDVGLSRKPLGESIGNKGLGFRSVVQITDAPRIYSQRPADPGENRFSGFCFRFAGADDLAALIEDPRHIELARRDLPIFHVPIWLDRQSDTICALAEDGFSTVIELPLRDGVAGDSVRQEINELRDQKVPMLLFLDRISSLIVRIVAETGKIETELAFTRSEETYEAAGMELARVNLGGAGLFLVARRDVAEAKMKEAIVKGIARKDLSEHWQRWTGDGNVAIAVRLDTVVRSPRLYTFLPMGEQAAAPFPGYLHGSFFPSSNRKHLNARIQLNAVLLEEATALAGEAIHHLIIDPSGKMAEWLAREELASAVVNFLCWDEVDSLETEEDLAADVARGLAERFGVEAFEDAPVVPCLLPEAEDAALTWQPPARVRRWPEGISVFSADVAARCARDLDIWPIWGALGPSLELLEVYLARHADSYAGAPRGEERARLVNLVAGKLGANRRTPKHDWIQFYQALPEFMGQEGQCLAGLPVLLGDDGQLHTAMSSTPRSAEGASSSRRRRAIETAVFSPPDPRRSDTEDDLEVDPPKKLSRRFAFLPTKLPWHSDLGAARTYLEQHRLVEEFDREAILAHLSRTLHGERNKEVLKGGLRWAFQLWRQPRAHSRPFKMQSQHRFRVPTLHGAYIGASQAVFSADWPVETAGGLLQQFLDAAPPGLPDLEKLAGRRLATPDHPAFRGRLIEDWVLFLAELGVNAGLEPELKIAKDTNFPADKISDFSFLEDYGIPLEFAELWRDDISVQDPSLLQLPSTTNYVIKGKLSWLLYAKLIFEWLSKMSDVPWDIEVHHYYSHRADRRDWRSPLKAFLRSARWFPVDVPIRSGFEPHRVRPCDVWMNNASGERFVPFLRRPSLLLRRHLEGASDHLIRSLVAHTGLRILDDPAFLPEQLEFLAQQYASEGFDKHFERHLINLYSRTWSLLSSLFDDGEHVFDPSAAPASILVRKGQAIELVSMFDEDNDRDEIVYVCDTDREGDINLLEASGRAFFQLRDGDARCIGELFEALYGDRIRRLSGVTYTLLTDGRDIGDGDVTSVLEICPQLRGMLAIAMEALSGTEAQRLPSDRSAVLAKLERLKIKKAEKLSFTIDGMDVSAGQDTISAFHFRLNDKHSVVVVRSSGAWTWELVDRSVSAICEALGHRALAPQLRLLVAHLRHGDPLGETQSNPFEDVERFAHFLQLSDSAALAARATLSAGLERQAPWIRAVLHLVAGAEAVEAFDQVSADALKDAGVLQDVLTKVLKEVSLSAEELLAICRTALGPEDFREELGLDFARFNGSLRDLGLEPETHPDLHKSRLENFIREKEVEITDCLRASCEERLDKMQPVEGYTVKRDELRTLEPDPAWLLLFKEPPEDVLETCLNAWLAQQGAPSLGGCNASLAPLAQVRKHNRQFVNNFAQRAIPLIRAWCAKFQPEHPLAPLAEESGTEGLRKRLDDIGVMDFRMLDDMATMKWLQVLEVWPADMPLSLELQKLDLSEKDLTAESIKAREASEERKRKARSVSFNGRILDPKDVDLLALSEELHQALSSKMLGRSMGSTADLADVQGRDSSSPRTGSTRSTKGRRARVPEEKTEFIGRLGEMAVYHWLRRILPRQDIDAAWRSENGTLITGREGDDGLGYDFEVSYRNQIWQIEVKASFEDPQSFEMGDTEVKAARVAARPRSGVQYKIAYVSYVSDPARTTIEMLPNPMSEEAARVLELRGEGIRYGFKRNQS
jgi:hypothetical protein